MNHEDTDWLDHAPWPVASQTSEQIRARFLGCLLGGAVGDAMGSPVEFMELEKIKEKYGADGITGYEDGYHGRATITDDTQMTLFTAEGLMRAWNRGGADGPVDTGACVARAYLRWLRTQDETRHDGIDLTEIDTGWLRTQQQLYDRRAPGMTCISALRRTNVPGMFAVNDSKGCGGVMRVAPVGLLGWHLGESRKPARTFQLGVDLAALTHGHPTGSLSSGVLAVLVLALVDGASLRDALAVAKVILREHPEHEETLKAIEKAQKLAKRRMDPVSAIAKLGEGWIAEEALAIPIYCALVARDFRHGILLSVNLTGDSDSTGAITGNLLGALHGVDAIPREWLEPLELRDVIQEMAADLHAFPRTWDDGNEDVRTALLKKYPPN